MARKDTWWKEGSLTALKVLGSKIDNTSHPLTTLCPEPFTLTYYQKGFRKSWRTEEMFWVHVQPYSPIVGRLFGILFNQSSQGNLISNH